MKMTIVPRALRDYAEWRGVDRRPAVASVTNPKPLKSHERIRDSRGRQGIVMLAADRYRYGV